MIQCRQFRSEADLASRVNDLAREFALIRGEKVSDGFKFYEANDRDYQQMWDLALTAYKQIYCHTDKNGNSYIEMAVELGIKQLDYYGSRHEN